jgi:hypothetical protein
VVREEAGQSRVEFPIGKLFYQTGGWISHPRVAFLDHPLRRDDEGSVSVVDLTGKSRILSTGWETVWGLAWAPSGDEIWFTGTKVGYGRYLAAVSLKGKERLVAREPGTLTLQDVARDGHVILTRDVPRLEWWVSLPAKPRSATLLGWIGRRRKIFPLTARLSCLRNREKLAAKIAAPTCGILTDLPPFAWEMDLDSHFRPTRNLFWVDFRNRRCSSRFFRRELENQEFSLSTK